MSRRTIISGHSRMRSRGLSHGRCHRGKGQISIGVLRATAGVPPTKVAQTARARAAMAPAGEVSAAGGTIQASGMQKLQQNPLVSLLAG